MNSAAYLATVARSRHIEDFWVEDASQEMRLALWQAGRDPDPEDFTTLDAIIVKREAIDFRRRLGGRQLQHEHFFTTFSAIEETLPSGLELADILPAVESISMLEIEDVLSGLKPRTAQMLLLYAVGFTFLELGRMFHVHESRACQIVKRGRKQLQAAA